MTEKELGEFEFLNIFDPSSERDDSTQDSWSNDS